MHGPNTAGKMTGLPEGFHAVPIHSADSRPPLQLCVLVRQSPDPVAGPFIRLRELPDARVFLGCVIDAAARVREWVELWIQNVDGLEASLDPSRASLCNHFLDEDWIRRCEVFFDLTAGDVLQTGWETVHPLPLFIDLANRVSIHPRTEEGENWELCRDDALLEKAGLPPYRLTLARYLYRPQWRQDPVLVPVSASAPSGPATRPLPEILGKIPNLAPLNAQGGLMRVTRFHPLGYEDYADLLGGKAWEGAEGAGKGLDLEAVYHGLVDWSQGHGSGAHLFLESQGRHGRFLEVFHLKLHLLLEVFLTVRRYLQKSKLPFLNLSPESFRVSLGPAGAGLPFLWTARCTLVKPGQAQALPLPTTEHHYYLRLGQTGMSVYLPSEVAFQGRGMGTVRIRKVLPPGAEGIIVEGTVLMPEVTGVSPNDLLHLRLPYPAGSLDLYGQVIPSENPAFGEARFRSLPQKLPAAVETALRSSEGVSLPRSYFEVIPLISSPCDLYSLGVIALRTLLVDEKNGLATVLDEFLSFARQAGISADKEAPLATRIREVFDRDSRWTDSLGPQHLTRNSLAAAEARQILPEELWQATLAFMARLFPGLGPDSLCRDLGDAPAQSLETVLDPPVAELRQLLVQSRSLILVDWNFNREVHAVVDEWLKKEQNQPR